jgi:hypothetical protein
MAGLYHSVGNPIALTAGRECGINPKLTPNSPQIPPKLGVRT